jgi:amidase
MEIELTVDLVRGFTRRLPFAEDEEYWMAIGVGGSLDAALRRATTGMVVYLEREHGLTSNESALVMGFSVEYDVADLVESQVSIVARLPRSVLLQLPPRKEPPF